MLYATSCYQKSHHVNWPLCSIYMWKSLLLSLFVLIVWTKLFGEGVASGFRGECMTPNVILRESDPEEEMYYSTDYVLHKTKCHCNLHMDQCCLCNDLTVMYIWISIT